MLAYTRAVPVCAMRRCYNFVKRREQSNACARKSYRFTIALLLSASEVLRLASVQQSLAIFCSANVGSILSAFDGVCLRVASTECYSDGEGVGDSTATFPWDRCGRAGHSLLSRGNPMRWTKPEFEVVEVTMEVTAYVARR